MTSWVKASHGVQGRVLRGEALRAFLGLGRRVLADGVGEIAQDRHRGSAAPGRAHPHCGMSIGFEDVTVGYTRPGRALLDETVTLIEG